MKITLSDPFCLDRHWPAKFVAVGFLIVAGNMLAYPLWALLLAKYREERESLYMRGNANDPVPVVVVMLDALAHAVLETAPSLVARALILYLGLCAGYVGISATFGYSLRKEKT